jgi:hypothetical protein
LLKHYISPEVGAVRRAIEKREMANPVLQSDVVEISRTA